MIKLLFHWLEIKIKKKYINKIETFTYWTYILTVGKVLFAIHAIN